ncbi:hypothetical protein AB0L53_40305 [Nonomuraea sp. NPDC052129]
MNGWTIPVTIAAVLVLALAVRTVKQYNKACWSGWARQGCDQDRYTSGA